MNVVVKDVIRSPDNVRTLCNLYTCSCVFRIFSRLGFARWFLRLRMILFTQKVQAFFLPT